MKIVSFDLKNWRKESLAVALFSVFMCCVFAPLEFYHGNYFNFWFSMDYIIGFIIVLAISIALITVILFSVNFKGKPYLGAVFWGLMVAMYIQGNFMLKSYGNLDGHRMILDLSSGYSIINTMFWLALPMISCLLICFREEISRLVIIYLSLGIFAVQTITLVSLWIITPVQVIGSETYDFTTDGIFDYSSDENIVMFVADTFAGELFEQLINENPSLTEYFDGFTWYSDYSGAYQLTNESVPFLFNPEWYFNQGDFDEIRLKSINTGGFFDRLKKEAGYDIVFCSTTQGFNKAYDKEIFDNLKRVDCDSQLSLGADYYKMLAFRYFPYILKKYFTVFTDTFERHKIVNDGFGIYADSNENFLKGLNDIPFTNNNTNKKFEIIHIRGAHFPYTVTSELQIVGDNETDILNQSIASIKILGQYLDKMKSNDTYDNTTIIFMSDHGLHDTPESQPLFLYKKKYSEGVMEINSTPISASQLLATLCNIIDLDYDANVQSCIDDSIDNGVRKYIYCNGESKKSLKNLVEYDVYPGLFMVKRNKYDIGMIENIESSSVKIVNGDVLVPDDIFTYSQVGVDEEGNISPSACFVFPTSIYNSGVQMKVKAEAVPGYKYQFYVSNKLVGEYTYEQFSDDGAVVEVPVELVDNGVVNLRIKTLGHIITGDELATSENPSGRGKYLKISAIKFLTPQ